MKILLIAMGIALSLVLFSTPVLAASTSSEITSYTANTLSVITLIASIASVLFLIKGGYGYITSTGKPEALEGAKKTIRNALIGLVIVLASGLIVSTLSNALNGATDSGTASTITISNIETVKPSEGLTQVLIDAVSGFIQNIVQSSTKPIVDGIMSFLTNTPSVLSNTTVRNFWLVSVGIVDSLFVLVVALLGLQLMSAGSFGFEEVELKQILPRIVVAFLGANISLFLAQFVIDTSNALVTTVLNATGGFNQAWIANAINPATLITGTTPLITLIFLVLFLILAIVLLLMYISRLIVISLGAVLSPFIFLLWTIPKFADFAEISIKSYLVSVLVVFVHLVVIQLAASYLAFPAASGNSLVSIAVAIGLFATLLKIPGTLMQFVFYSSGRGVIRKLGTQIMNVMTTDNASTASRAANTERVVKTPRKVIQA